MADSLREICYGIIQGFRDSILGTLKVYKLDAQKSKDVPKTSEPKTTLAKRRAEKMKQKEADIKETKKKETKVIRGILQCCAWNGGVFLTSILIFNGVVLPCLQWFTEAIFGDSEQYGLVWGWMSAILSWTFGALWILPLFVLSKFVNCFWFQDIADAAYLQSRGRPTPINISVLIADLLFSVTLQAFFLIQSTLAGFLPIPTIGWMVGILHMSLLYSLYAFEYKWFNMGWEVHKRLRFIESCWPYFCGFGLPLAILTTLHPSVIISGCIFSFLFPLFIISANEAEETVPTFHMQLKLFEPVVALTNAIFRHSVSIKGSHMQAGTSSSQSPRKQTRISNPSDLR